MYLFHKHKFKIILKTYTKQYLSLKGDMSECMAERLFLGITTCILQCDYCGKIIKEELLGEEKL